MKLSPVFAPAAMIVAALAAPQLHIQNTTNSAFSQSTSSNGGFIGHVPSQAPKSPLMKRVPEPTPAPTFNDTAPNNTTSWTAIITSVIIVESDPDSWFPFSWGPWMLPPLEDITCSVTSSSTSVPSWESPDFPWIIPPRRQVLTESPTSPTSTATVPQWTESAPGSWGVQPRDGVTCVATSSASSSRSMTTPIPIWGGGGTSFFWGLPPQDDQVSTDAPLAMSTATPSDWPIIFVTVVSTATFASESLGSVTSTLVFRSADEDSKMVFKRQADVTTVTETETDIFFSTAASSQTSEPDMSLSSMPSTTETHSDYLPLTTSKKAIPTLSATTGPDLITASSACECKTLHLLPVSKKLRLVFGALRDIDKLDSRCLTREVTWVIFENLLTKDFRD